jgi:hypothetical protein
MTPARLRLMIVLGASLLTVCWFLWWSSTSVQADRTFARLQAAIEQGRASGVLDNLHPQYDIKGSWPNKLGGDASADPFVFRYTVTSVEAQEDDTVAVTVTIDLSTTSGHRPLTFTPSLTNQRFVLAQDGWWPALYIRSHPPFNVSY